MSTITGTRIDQVLHDAVEPARCRTSSRWRPTTTAPTYEGAAGPRSPAERHGHCRHDFRIASMTKMVTTVAALQLVEEGKLDLDDPVESTARSSANLQVLEGFDGDDAQACAPPQDQGHRAPARQPHVAGSTYWFWNEDVARWEQVTGTPNVLSGDEAIFTAPLVADPGTTYEYGINTDWLGRVVEAASGQPLDGYIDRAHPQAARHGAHGVRTPTSSARTWCRSTCAARTARGRRPSSTGRRDPTGGPAATGCTPPRATTCASSRCCSTAARSTARRSSTTGPTRRRSATRSATSTSPR